jgi:hypothetical protein
MDSFFFLVWPPMRSTYIIAEWLFVTTGQPEGFSFNMAIDVAYCPFEYVFEHVSKYVLSQRVGRLESHHDIHSITCIYNCFKILYTDLFMIHRKMTCKTSIMRA